MVIIIGLTGTFGSGKGTVAHLLAKKGFHVLRCSDVIRDICNKKGLAQTRENLFKISKELIEQEGEAAVVEHLEPFFKEKTVIDGLRRIAEVDYLRSFYPFVLLALDADPKQRYRRIQKRKDTTDQVTFEEFLKAEEKELSNQGQNMQLAAVMQMADYFIMNNGSFKELEQELEKFLLFLDHKGLIKGF